MTYKFKRDSGEYWVYCTYNLYDGVNMCCRFSDYGRQYPSDTPRIRSKTLTSNLLYAMFYDKLFYQGRK